jgi:hypothetical protein
MMQKKWLYFFAAACSVTGSAWVIWNRIYYTPSGAQTGINACLFKAATGLPCPSCGSTRSVLALMQLHFGDALYANPFGYIIALAIILLPVWVGYDLAVRRRTLYDFYLACELTIRKRWVAVSLILLVAANWAWNIYKYTS